MENVRFLQGVKQYFCTKALDVILLIIYSLVLYFSLINICGKILFYLCALLVFFFMH